MTDVHLTPTEKRLLEVFADGQPHSVEELMKSLWDELSTTGALRVRIHNLRNKLLPRGMSVISTRLRNRKKAYIQVRLLGSVHD